MPVLGPGQAPHPCARARMALQAPRQDTACGQGDGRLYLPAWSPFSEAPSALSNRAVDERWGSCCWAASLRKRARFARPCPPATGRRTSRPIPPLLLPRQMCPPRQVRVGVAPQVDGVRLLPGRPHFRVDGVSVSVWAARPWMSRSFTGRNPLPRERQPGTDLAAGMASIFRPRFGAGGCAGAGAPETAPWPGSFASRAGPARKGPIRASPTGRPLVSA